MALTIVDQWSSFLEWVPDVDSPTLVPPGIGVYPTWSVVSIEAVPKARRKGSVSDVLLFALGKASEEGWALAVS